MLLRGAQTILWPKRYHRHRDSLQDCVATTVCLEKLSAETYYRSWTQGSSFQILTFLGATNLRELLVQLRKIKQEHNLDEQNYKFYKGLKHQLYGKWCVTGKHWCLPMFSSSSEIKPLMCFPPKGKNPSKKYLRNRILVFLSLIVWLI